MSRKISEDAANAFEAGRKFSRDNTQVYEQELWNDKTDKREPYMVLALHGNEIARYPIDLGWYNAGQVRHCGWIGHGHQVTGDRLNALSKVCVYTEKECIWLNGYPWVSGGQVWVSHQGEREKCSRQLGIERDLTMARIEGLALAAIGAGHWRATPAKFIRQRNREPIHMMEVRMPQFKHDAEVFVRDWARKPNGEIVVRVAKPGRKLKRITVPFSCWKHFDAALEEAERHTAPDLVLLADAAADILAGK